MEGAAAHLGLTSSWNTILCSAAVVRTPPTRLLERWASQRRSRLRPDLPATTSNRSFSIVTWMKEADLCRPPLLPLRVRRRGVAEMMGVWEAELRRLPRVMKKAPPRRVSSARGAGRLRPHLAQTATERRWRRPASPSYEMASGDDCERGGASGR